MNIICSTCSSKFKISDNKIPTDRVVSIPCPKCKSNITISFKKSDDEIAGRFDFEETDFDSCESPDKPFDFIEEEGKTALICESNPKFNEKFKNVTELMDYHSTTVSNSRDALAKMRYHTYDLIIVNELFDTKDPDSHVVITYLERLSMSLRRNTFVTVISDRYHTMDHLMALKKSTNLIINTKHIAETDKILSKMIASNDFFFRAFNETLKEIGRI